MVQCSIMCMYMYQYMLVERSVEITECRGFESHPRQLIFLGKNGHLGCVVLLCFVVCMTLLASFFLPSASLINMYMYVVHVHVCCTSTCMLYMYMYVVHVGSLLVLSGPHPARGPHSTRLQHEGVHGNQYPHYTYI